MGETFLNILRPVANFPGYKELHLESWFTPELYLNSSSSLREEFFSLRKEIIPLFLARLPASQVTPF
jgi:hypothetical protein